MIQSEKLGSTPFQGYKEEGYKVVMTIDKDFCMRIYDFRNDTYTWLYGWGSGDELLLPLSTTTFYKYDGDEQVIWYE